MNITIPGGGDTGTLMAAECARKQHRVTVHTSRTGLWSLELDVHARDDAFLFSGRIAEVTAPRSRAAGSIRIILSAEPIPRRGGTRAPCAAGPTGRRHPGQPRRGIRLSGIFAKRTSRTAPSPISAAPPGQSWILSSI